MRKAYLRFIVFIGLTFSLLITAIIIEYFLALPALSFLSVFSVGTAFYWFLLLCCMLVSLWNKSKQGLWMLLVLGISYWVFSPWFILSSDKLVEISVKDKFSIMTFNAHGFNKNLHFPDDTQVKLIEFLNTNLVDILVIQEYSRERYQYLNNYPFYYHTPIGEKHIVQAVLSKYPIIRSGSLDLNNSWNNAIYADIKIKEDTIRVYNFHLESFNIIPSEAVADNNKVKRGFQRINRGMIKQASQAEAIRNHIRQSKINKIILAGDMNNTQFSTVYRIIKGDFKDSFKEKGSGFGKTYSLLNLPMRIDYVFASEGIDIRSHKNFEEQYSDHYPIEVEFIISE